jgi:tetratricopeptide (TPR) repeat protein
MSLVNRLFASVRVREKRHKLAEDQSAHNYVELAREHAQTGEMQEVQRVCSEGLEVFPGNGELLRLLERSKQLEREDRTRELYRLLREAPRPALYRELCEILLDSGRVARAEECARDWYNSTGDGQAQLVRAEARLERFFADKRRDDARLAIELVEGAEKLLPRDPRPFELIVELYTRIGAWKEARFVLSKLLELRPGDLGLEARFRALLAKGDASPTVDQALRQIEKSGMLVDEAPIAQSSAPRAGSIRPRLQEIVAEPDVAAAIYVRGATALVQGPKGPTAERHARSVREVVQKSAAAARRLGLGQAFEVRLDGDFGTLLIAPGELGSGAMWLKKPVEERHRGALLDLVGIAGTGSETDE